MIYLNYIITLLLYSDGGDKCLIVAKGAGGDSDEQCHNSDNSG